MSISQGYVWVPYIIVTTTPIIASAVFSPSQSLKSRYSIWNKSELRNESLNKLLYPLLYDPDSLGSSNSSSSTASSSICNSIKYIEMSSNTKSI